MPVDQIWGKFVAHFHGTTVVQGSLGVVYGRQVGWVTKGYKFTHLGRIYKVNDIVDRTPSSILLFFVNPNLSWFMRFVRCEGMQGLVNDINLLNT